MQHVDKAERLAQFKGSFGEQLAYDKLKPFEQTGAKILTNLYIPKSDGTTTEIDLMMISPKGAFIFEVKNYSGWIFGNAKDFRWTQTLPQKRAAHKEHFYNPILQNKNHIKHLQTLIGDIDAFSVVVFSDDCEFKTEFELDNKTCVVHMRHLYSMTMDLYNRSDIVFTPDIIDAMYNMLKPYSCATQDVKDAHLQDVSRYK